MCLIKILHAFIKVAEFLVVHDPVSLWQVVTFVGVTNYLSTIFQNILFNEDQD